MFLRFCKLLAPTTFATSSNFSVGWNGKRLLPAKPARPSCFPKIQNVLMADENPESQTFLDLISP
jgi:hypothetical protein